MRYVYMLLIVLFTAAVLVFAAYNFDHVVVSVPGWSASLPLAALILIVYVLGMLTGGIVWSAVRRSIRGASRR